MTAPDVNADVRARFEAWAMQRGWPIFRCNEDMPDAAQYEDGFVSCAWLAYRAAHADLSGEVRELVEAASDGHETPTAHVKPQVGLYFNPAKAERLRAALAKFHPTHPEKP